MEHENAKRIQGEAELWCAKTQEGSFRVDVTLLHPKDLQAQTALSESLRIAKSKSDVWTEMAAQIGLGDGFILTGDLVDANTANMAALRLAEGRLATDPANTQWQRDLLCPPRTELSKKRTAPFTQMT